MEYLWKDRKRHLGLPLSFTKYSLTEDRIFRETGVFTLKEEEVLLYRIRDISLTRTLGQRIFGVGTICLQSSDATSPHLELVNVKHPKDVKEQIYRQVEAAKDARRIRTTELLDGDVEGDLDGDGVSDDCEV